MINADGFYTNLGLLLSDQNPHVIKAAVFNGTGMNEFQNRQEFEGGIFRILNDLYAFLDKYNQLGAKFDGLYRIDTYDYPDEAIREWLLNMLVHRD